jgi:hypothetical protein
MKSFRKIYALLRPKILGAENLPAPASTEPQRSMEHSGISEKFKQQVENLVERYREALEALAKE